jgi:hypothetical protein
MGALRCEEDVMNGKPQGPGVTEILEFARRTEAVNLDVPIGKILEATGVLERSLAAADGGWVLVNPHYVLVTGAVRDLGDPALQAPVRGAGPGGG